MGRIPLRSNHPLFFASCGPLISFTTRANAQWVFELFVAHEFSLKLILYSITRLTTSCQ